MIRKSSFIIHKSLVVFLLAGVFLAVFPALAQNGLVPCSGINCTLCDLFRLFQNIFNFVIQYIVPSVAIIGIAWGGWTLLISGGREEKVKSGRKILINTFVGLAIAYSAFVVASSVIGFLAPDSARFSFSGGTFRLQCTASPVEDVTGQIIREGRIGITIPSLLEAEEDVNANIEGLSAATAAVETALVNGDNIESSTRAPREIVLKLRLVAQRLKSQNIKLRVAAAYRSMAEQIRLININCNGKLPIGSPPNPHTVNCNPKPGKAQTCMLKNGLISCPHTTGRAVDISGAAVFFGSYTGSEAAYSGKSAEEMNALCVNQVECINQGSACFDNPCRKPLIEAMKAEGFCVLASEPWHFEYPKMSRSCN